MRTFVYPGPTEATFDWENCRPAANPDLAGPDKPPPRPEDDATAVGQDRGGDADRTLVVGSYLIAGYTFRPSASCL
jgi:hypothetical protein